MDTPVHLVIFTVTVLNLVLGFLIDFLLPAGQVGDCKMQYVYHSV